jgi:putative nucleotidyltransferase with HDIG domain
MNVAGSVAPPASPLAALPFLPQLCGRSGSVAAPEDTACFALWEKYAMLPNIRRHSLLVAHIATALAQRAEALGLPVKAAQVRASALLHDLAKTYCVRYGGSHAQLGAAWTVAETGNYAVAQGVMLHVWWPWDLPQGRDICALPFFVMYADKRVRHDVCVTLEERYDDLLQRYGRSEEAREGIRAAYRQGKTIEGALAALLGWSLHENSFDCGRLVH